MYKRFYFENCALLGYYAERSGNLLPTFRDNLLVPSSGVKNLDSRRWDVWIIIIKLILNLEGHCRQDSSGLG
jgi:hypothetical protein